MKCTSAVHDRTTSAVLLARRRLSHRFWRVSTTLGPLIRSVSPDDARKLAVADRAWQKPITPRDPDQAEVGAMLDRDTHRSRTAGRAMRAVRR